MREMTVLELLEATGGRLLRHGEPVLRGVAIDSRKVKPGELFVAIKGDRFDGHRFIAGAVENGASVVLLSDPRFAPDRGAVVRVRDTRKALGDLAAFYRKRLGVRVLAVTGSNGKTTVRRMAAAILSRTFRVVEAPENYNNEIGVPLTVFGLEPDTEVGVFEIEMNEPDGTRQLARVCRPEVGVVTNVGDAHLETMKNRRGVAREKAELLEELPESGTAVLNADDRLVMEIGKKHCSCRRVTFGLESKADVFATDVRDLGLDGTRFLLQGRHEMRVPVPGRFNLANCLAACGAAHALGVGFAGMAAGLAGFRPPRMRLAVRRLGETVLIDDSYNSNPQSVRAALELLRGSAPAGKRVALLGDMLELGADAVRFHSELGQLAADCADRVLFVGPLCEHAASVAIKAGMKPECMRLYGTSGQVRAELFDMVKPGDTILVKGSRAMSMELIVQNLVEHYGE